MMSVEDFEACSLESRAHASVSGAKKNSGKTREAHGNLLQQEAPRSGPRFRTLVQLILGV